MIAKIFKARATFAVRYNTGKVNKGLGELVKVANFGPLTGFAERRPEDYIAYLQMVSAINKRINSPSFHATISTDGRRHSSEELSRIAERWLRAMGYGDQPYLLVFHKDTQNNHVHIVSTRVGRDGKKINSGFEHVRAVQEINKIAGLDESQAAQKDINNALAYQFGSKAQFGMILENQGYIVTEKDGALQVIKFGHLQGTIGLDQIEKHLSAYQPDKQRALQLRAIFRKYLQQFDAQGLAVFLKKNLGINILFHGTAGKTPYGYSVIDHSHKRIFKGGDILPLKALLHSQSQSGPEKPVVKVDEKAAAHYGPLLRAAAQNYGSFEEGMHDLGLELERAKGGWVLVDEKENTSFKFSPGQLSIWIANDVDDQQINGPRRRRQKKARTNTR